MELRSAEIRTAQMELRERRSPSWTVHHLLNCVGKARLIALADPRRRKGSTPVGNRNPGDAELPKRRDVHAFDRLAGNHREASQLATADEAVELAVACDPRRKSPAGELGRHL